MLSPSHRTPWRQHLQTTHLAPFASGSTLALAGVALAHRELAPYIRLFIISKKNAKDVASLASFLLPVFCFREYPKGFTSHA